MYDCIIIGAGASGLMAASILNDSNLKVLLIDKNEEIGKKLLLTGGGRCNLLNYKDTNSFIKTVTTNGKFLYSSLSLFGPIKAYEYFEENGLKLKLEDNDRVFPVSNKSKDVIDMFLNNINNIELMLNTEVIDIDKDKMIVHTTNKSFGYKNLIIATGGVSYKHTGSDGFGYEVAKKLGHNVTKLYPCETFIRLYDVIPFAGITLDNIKIKYLNYEFNGSLLFTHIGITGSSVFKISEYVYKNINKSKDIYIDLIPDINEQELYENIMSLGNFKFMLDYIPKRILNYILENHDLSISSNINEISKNTLSKLCHYIKNMEVCAKSTGDLDSCIVTGGGVDVKEINPSTMESKLASNIYFVGETLDVHGQIGGYNLSICFATGYAAALDIINKN